MARINKTDSTRPDYVRSEYLAAAPDLLLVEHLLAGTRAMWDNASTYIRKWSDEEPAVYKIRSKITNLFEGLGRTLSAAVGMLFAKPPEIDWGASETALAPHWENIDSAGTHGNVFVKRFAEDAIPQGIGLILVDHPAPPAGVVVHSGNEELLNLRPTWAMYRRDQVINWDDAVINNQRTLTLLVLDEVANVRDGAFGRALRQRYRVLELVPVPPEAPGEPTRWTATWRVQERVEEQGKVSFPVIEFGDFRNREGLGAERLPVSVAYTGRTREIMDATLPLMGVAWANLAHYQAATNLEFYRSFCAFPQPTIEGDLAGGEGATVKIGPAVAVHVEQGGKFGWAELEGTSLERLEYGVQEKKTEMAQQGLSFLQTDTRAAETAEAKRLDASAENSTLATAAQGIEDAVNLAWEIHAWYMGIEKKDAPTLQINRNFDPKALDPQTLQQLRELRAAGDLSRQTLWERMKHGQLLGDRFDPDEEVRRIAEDDLDSGRNVDEPDPPRGQADDDDGRAAA